MKSSTWAWTTIAFGLVLSACAADVPQSVEEELPFGVEQALDQSFEQSELLEQVEVGQASAPSKSGDTEDHAPFDENWRVSETGFGPIRIGMSLEEATTAVDGAMEIPDELWGCDYVSPKGWPEGIWIMVVDGVVARVDIRRGNLATSAGARIGSTEAEIGSIYSSRIQSEPHKYTDGNYLIVTPEGESGTGYRIIFETDGERVVNYRAGALPEVGWVEGCA